MRPEDSTSYHIERVASVVQHGTFRGGQLPEADIARSWVRCMRRYGLDPAQVHQPVIIEHTNLVERQERLNSILEVARFEMNNLYQQISGSGYAVLLTDSEGVIIHCVTDPALVDLFTRSGLQVGAIWSEQHEGTNGMGTCLIEKQPITVHRNEHFHSCHIGLTCSAAPIFDPHGSLLAVLDASSANSRDSKQSQFHTMALATISAKLIENCDFLHHFSSDWVLRFHNRPEFVGLLSEGMLAFDGEGRILAVNQSALNQLHCSKREDLIDLSISNVFDVRLDSLMGHSGRQSDIAWPLHDMRGRRFFAMLRGAERRPANSRPLSLKGTTTPPPRMSLDSLRGDDLVMANNVRRAQRVMNTDVAILLRGETGTGKEAFAKAIHQASLRADKPFMAVNCASIPETLIESELFGYKHGAFTWARREGMRGKILQASGGTLFLDEIGDMPLTLQTRLLRVVEEKEVLPLGCETPIPVDLHVISATHRNLRELIARGEFREDLYYRLNSLTLTLPALRERSDSISLIRRILVAESGSKAVEIDAEAFAALTSYPWPGNIRQLRNVLRTAVVLCEDDIIRMEDLPPEITEAPPKALPKCPDLLGRPELQNERSALGNTEKEILLRELNKHRWNLIDTALHMGISRNTLYRKMKKYGITKKRSITPPTT